MSDEIAQQPTALATKSDDLNPIVEEENWPLASIDFHMYAVIMAFRTQK